MVRKPARKSAARSTKAKTGVAKKAAKPSTKRKGQSLSKKTVGRCVATLAGFRKGCVAKVQSLVGAGHSIFRTTPRKRKRKLA